MHSVTAKPPTMPRKKCVAKGCDTMDGTGHSMHQFPKDPVMRKIWVDDVCEPGVVPKDSSLVCSLHFPRDAYTRFHDIVLRNLPRQRRKLRPDAVPMERYSLLQQDEQISKRAREEVRNASTVICHVKVSVPTRTCYFTFVKGADAGLRRTKPAQPYGQIKRSAGHGTEPGNTSARRRTFRGVHGPCHDTVPGNVAARRRAGVHGRRM